MCRKELVQCELIRTFLGSFVLKYKYTWVYANCADLGGVGRVVVQKESLVRLVADENKSKRSDDGHVLSSAMLVNGLSLNSVYHLTTPPLGQPCSTSKQNRS